MDCEMGRACIIVKIIQRLFELHGITNMDYTNSGDSFDNWTRVECIYFKRF
jgi:hypothetical protein